MKFSNIKSQPGDPNNDSGMLEKFTDELDLDGLPMEGEVSQESQKRRVEHSGELK